MMVIIRAHGNHIFQLCATGLEGMLHGSGGVASIMLAPGDALVGHHNRLGAVEREQATTRVVRVLIQAEDVPHP